MRADAQRDIACYELLAQIALLWARAQFSHPARLQVCLPSMSDNTSAEAVANTLFTTSLPLKFFAQTLSLWAVQLCMSLDVDRIPGENNQWADELSRSPRPESEGFSPLYRINVPLQDILAVRSHEA